MFAHSSTSTNSDSCRPCRKTLKLNKNLKVDCNLIVRKNALVKKILTTKDLDVLRNAHVGHDLKVDHDVHVANDLQVDHDAKVANDLQVDHDAKVDGNLQVQGDAEVKDLHVKGDAKFDGNIVVDGMLFGGIFLTARIVNEDTVGGEVYTVQKDDFAVFVNDPAVDVELPEPYNPKNGQLLTIKNITEGSCLKVTGNIYKHSPFMLKPDEAVRLISLGNEWQII